MRRGGAPSSMTLSDSVYERLLQQRIIVLGQQVDDDIANRIAAQMLLLAAEDPVADIALYINSPGGSVTAGMAMFATMEFIPGGVATYAMWLAASMGQCLLAAGARGKRYALPHCQILMHQPSAGVGGTEADIAIQAELFRRHKQEMAQLISGHTGQPVEKIIADFDRDRWFSAQEALEYGFVDHVISRAGQLPDAISENGNGSARWATHRRSRGTCCRPSWSARATGSRSRTRTTSCSRSASSSSACRSTTRRPTTSWRSCWCSSRWTPTATSPCTSTRRVARS